jgi:hypothetical protein
MLDVLESLRRTVRTTERDLESSSKGGNTRTVIVHPQVGRDKAEAQMMADDTPTESGKWQGWLYREIKAELERVDFGRLPESGGHIGLAKSVAE